MMLPFRCPCYCSVHLNIHMQKEEGLLNIQDHGQIYIQRTVMGCEAQSTGPPWLVVRCKFKQAGLFLQLASYQRYW